jgi:ABC-2 type transport system ATP-binding protein
MPATNLLHIELEHGPDGLRLDDIKALPEVQSAELDGALLNVGVSDLSSGAPRILQWLADAGHPYNHVASERASLEAVFLSLTGRSLRD